MKSCSMMCVCTDPPSPGDVLADKNDVDVLPSSCCFHVRFAAIATAGRLLGPRLLWPLCCLFLALPVAAVLVPRAGSAFPAMSQPSGGSTAGNGLIAPSGHPVGSLAPPYPPSLACTCMHARGANCGCSGSLRVCD